MSIKTIFTIILFVICIASYVIYLSFHFPEDIKAKNDQDLKIANIAYKTSMVTLLCAIVSLISQLIDSIKKLLTKKSE